MVTGTVVNGFRQVGGQWKSGRHRIVLMPGWRCVPLLWTLSLALVRNVPVLKRAIFRQAGFTWWRVDDIAVLVSPALLLLPIDELAAKFAVSPTRVRYSYPIRTVHR
jgi:hypothetical protein